MMTDKQLVEGCKSGQQEHLEFLIVRYRDDLYRFCRHLTLNRQDAEDLFQEVWVRVLRKLEKYDAERPFKPWLFQVAFNMYRDRYRKWKSVYALWTWLSSDAELIHIRDPAPLAEEDLLRHEEHRHLEECLRSLPKRYLAPLILYYYEEFSYEGIAEVLGVPLGTVKSRLNHGKKLLHKLMKEMN
ncbi:RNA polymerase sigma factor [Paenibacillus sp. FSL M7-0896]|uniref:RNA polymerase sigma factor n=1 Tax=Paenibacillus sp. FSL M7-0896 TaxID=2921610 RepID=UPI0030D8C170